MSDLSKRLRGLYSCGPDGVYEDRDFGSYTPPICKEAADKIDGLELKIKEIKGILFDAGLHVGGPMKRAIETKGKDISVDMYLENMKDCIEYFERISQVVSQELKKLRGE